MENTRSPVLDEVNLRRVRRRGIGGSDVAAILGISRFKTAHDVWMEKLGLVESERDTEAMRWGRILEPHIGAEYARRENVEIYYPESRFIRDPQHAWVLGNIDFLVRNRPVGVDCKSVSPFATDGWGDPGTDEIPDDALCQAQWYLMIMREQIQRWDIPALKGSRLDIYRVQPDRDLQQTLFELARAFWFDYVLAQVPPPVDASKGARKMLQRLWPREVAGMREATAQELDLLQTYARVREAFFTALQAKDMLENTIEDRIQDATGLQGPWGKITWKKTKDSQKTEWEAVARALWNEYALRLHNKHADLLLTEERQVWDEIVQQYTRQEPGARRFYAKFTGMPSEEDSAHGPAPGTSALPAGNGTLSLDAGSPAAGAAEDRTPTS